MAFKRCFRGNVWWNSKEISCPETKTKMRRYRVFLFFAPGKLKSKYLFIISQRAAREEKGNLYMWVKHIRSSVLWICIRHLQGDWHTWQQASQKARVLREGWTSSFGTPGTRPPFAGKQVYISDNLSPRISSVSVKKIIIQKRN